MKDPDFIHLMVTKGNDARDKFNQEVANLTTEQLNWKPAPESWSAGQCLDHLIVADSLYFPALRSIADGSFKMTAWEKFSPFGGLFGRLLVGQVQENVKRKLNAPKVFTPSASQVDPEIVPRFREHLDTLVSYISSFSDVDVDKTHITSPVSKFITYSLRHAISLLIQHEHRHLNQAIRAKKTAGAASETGFKA